MAELRLKSVRFRAEREADWQRLEALLAKAEGHSAKALTDEELLAMPVLYRASLSSLSVARATSLDSALIDYLESLCTRAYFFVYGARTNALERIRAFFAHDWPAAAKALWRETLIWRGPDHPGHGDRLCARHARSGVVLRLRAAGPGRGAGARGDHGGAQGDAVRHQPQRHAFGVRVTFLFTHNAEVALLAFSLGFALCVPSAFLMVINGCTLGALVAVFVQHGLGFDLGGWLLIHGVTELFATVLAGAAGVRIGWSLAFPGERTRLESVAAARRQSAVLMGGVLGDAVPARRHPRRRRPPGRPGHPGSVMRSQLRPASSGSPISMRRAGRSRRPRVARAPNAWTPTIGQPARGRFERELVTPEGVDLRVRLGEASERAAAFLLDAAIIIGALILLTVVLISALIGAGLNKVSAQIMAVIWLLGSFLLRNAYFILFELTPRAATPGKRALGLRVAARNGGRLTADAIFARNAMRELEVFLPLTFLISQSSQVDAWLDLLGAAWCSIFVFFPLFNRDRLRVGDLVAGTWVVKAPRRKLMADVAETALAGRTAFGGQGEFAFTQAQVDAYAGPRSCTCSKRCCAAPRSLTIIAVAARIRGKIKAGPKARTNPDYDFLDAYYLALRGRLESRLPVRPASPRQVRRATLVEGAAASASGPMPSRPDLSS